MMVAVISGATTLVSINLLGYYATLIVTVGEVSVAEVAVPIVVLLSTHNWTTHSAMEG